MDRGWPASGVDAGWGAWTLSSLSPIGAALAVTAVIAIVAYAASRDPKRILLRDFAAVIEPEGEKTACEIRFPTEDAATPCAVQATPAGWYMVTPQPVLAKYGGWLSAVPLLPRPVFIPWSALHYRRASFPLANWLKFEIRSAQVTFFVRRSVALELLRNAGRPPPEA